MKKLIQILLIVIAVTGLISSCNIVAPESATASPIIVNISTATIPLATPTLTKTPPIPTATSMPFSQFNFSCWEIKPLQKGNDIKGSIIYASNEVNRLFEWDISSLQSRTLKGSFSPKIVGPSYVSPDGKNIAMLSDKGLVLISRESIKSFSLPKEKLPIRAYLTDSRILLTQDNTDNYKEGIGLTDTYYIFDPVTGITTDHRVFLPGFEADLTWGVWTSQYSSDMKYILYRSTSSKDDIEFTLYDLINNKVVWVGPPRASNLKTSWDSVPDWQPNTDILTAHYIDINTHKVDYYSINLTGNVSPITNLNGIELDNTVIPSQSWWSYRAESPNWSPNGRYLVSAGVQESDKSKYWLYIWDNQEKIGYKPCLPDEQKITIPRITTWSFDSSHVIVDLNFGGPGQYAYGKSYILDLNNKIIYEIPDDNKGFNVLGWVNWETP